MSGQQDPVKMPKWLLYGLVAKGVILAAIVIGVTVWLSVR